jgi:chaperonin cofactor prefoldin
MRLRLRTKELDRLYERKAKLEVELERLSKKQEVLKEELRKVDRQILLATKKLEKR